MFSITLVPIADVVPVKSDMPYHEQEQGQWEDDVQPNPSGVIHSAEGFAMKAF